jgi:hypothetical protein
MRSSSLNQFNLQTYTFDLLAAAGTAVGGMILYSGYPETCRQGLIAAWPQVLETSACFRGAYHVHSYNALVLTARDLHGICMAVWGESLAASTIPPDLVASGARQVGDSDNRCYDENIWHAHFPSAIYPSTLGVGVGK